MPNYIPGISSTGSLAPGLSAATVRAVLELLSSAEIAAAYLPIAGGTMAGSIDMDGYNILNADTIAATVIDKGGLPVATEAFASNASNLTSGTVPDARLSANVARLNSANTGASIATTTFIVQAIASQTSPIQEWKRSDGVVCARVDTIGRADIYSARYHAGSGVGIAYVSICNPNLGIAIYNAGSINWSSTGFATETADVKILRNATGPTLETRAAGGLRVANADGSALAAMQCGTASVLVSTGLSGVVIGNTLSSQAGIGFYSSGTRLALYGDNGVAMLLGNSTNIMANGRPLVFSVDASGLGTTRISEASSGVLQIGTTSNNALGSLNLANLTASGVAKFTGYPTGLLPAAASNAGSITYDTTLAKHVGCNGSSWNALW